MTDTILAAAPAPPSSRDRWALTALVTLALLFTAFFGVIAALGGGHIAWAFSSRFFPALATIHWDQWLSVALWAVLTGGLFALSVGATSATVLTGVLAILSGVLIPIGLILWARFLGRYWPGITGPSDQPWPSIALAVYSAVAPWFLGRSVRQLGRSGSAPR